MTEANGLPKMPIEKINQYLREHGYDPEKVGLRGQILAEALTKNIIAREIIQRLLADPGGCRFCDFGVLRKPDNPLKGHDENCPYLAAHAYLDNETSTVVKRDLSDAEIDELGAQEAERKEFCPNCEAEVPCTHEAELYVCDICGEDFAKYIVSRSANVSDVSTTQDVLTGVKTPSSIENTNPDYYKQELARIAELEEENDRLQSAWFEDETICPDGSLRPKVSTLLDRIAELEGLVDELIEAGESMSLAVECENQIEANAYYSWKELVKDWKEREE